MIVNLWGCQTDVTESGGRREVYEAPEYFASTYAVYPNFK